MDQWASFPWSAVRPRLQLLVQTKPSEGGQAQCVITCSVLARCFLLLHSSPTLLFFALPLPPHTQLCTCTWINESLCLIMDLKFSKLLFMRSQVASILKVGTVATCHPRISDCYYGLAKHHVFQQTFIIHSLVHYIRVFIPITSRQLCAHEHGRCCSDRSRLCSIPGECSGFWRK